MHKLWRASHGLLAPALWTEIVGILFAALFFQIGREASVSQALIWSVVVAWLAIPPLAFWVGVWCARRMKK